MNVHGQEIGYHNRSADSEFDHLGNGASQLRLVEFEKRCADIAVRTHVLDFSGQLVRPAIRSVQGACVMTDLPRSLS